MNTGEYYIPKLERPYKDCAIETNYTLYVAYRESKKLKQKLLDFADIIWGSDIEEIDTTLKESNIKEFTISARFCNLTDRLASFESLGWKVEGTTNVKTHLTNRDGSSIEVKAMKITRK